MFFILSKVLVFLLRPVSWLAILFLLAIFLKNKKWKRRCLIYAAVLFFFVTNHFIVNQVIKAWELDGIHASEMQAPYDICILLGGYSNPNIEDPNPRFQFNTRANRLTQAVELYQQGKFKKILLTGGSGSLMQNLPSEALQSETFLQLMGIPEEDIIIEADSRNTRENAVFTKAILDEKYPNASLLLITSAWHMRRSKACYDKVGLTFDYHCTDHVGEINRLTPESVILPNSDGFIRWDMLIKEMVGYFMYWLKGYV